MKIISLVITLLFILSSGCLEEDSGSEKKVNLASAYSVPEIAGTWDGSTSFGTTFEMTFIAEHQIRPNIIGIANVNDDLEVIVAGYISGDEFTFNFGASYRLIGTVKIKDGNMSGTVMEKGKEVTFQAKRR